MGRGGPNRSELWEKRDYSIAGNRVEVTLRAVLILIGTNTGGDGHVVYRCKHKVLRFGSCKVSNSKAPDNLMKKT